ncbi:Hypothetical protein CINCED_3A007474 [Cinara cedri]|uniref:Harbinger transposase-derived nuclease domain n=1 Tax=Cinara cedri TaxID=506608 RepID=A0A5E4M9J7_9HEMI|nr:Hypothetical protein CINCED_3A007474 [Cinara cedri]
MTESDDYRNFLRMDATSFENLLKLVTSNIQKQNTIMMEAISVNERLSITLRYLATGNTFEDLTFLSAILPQSISNIVQKTCQAIITSLKTINIEYVSC